MQKIKLSQRAKKIIDSFSYFLDSNHLEQSFSQPINWSNLILYYQNNHFYLVRPSQWERDDLLMEVDLDFLLAVTLINFYNHAQEIEARAIDFYLRDDNYQAVINEDHYQRVNELKMILNQSARLSFESQSDQFNAVSQNTVDIDTGSENFSDLTPAKKLKMIQHYLAQFFPMLELVDLEDNCVIINLNTDSSCEQDKVLEAVHSMLQQHLKTDQINVISEY
jgi:hypothetical protein